MPSKQRKPGCTDTYTWRKVKGDITYLYEQKRSLRAVAKEFGKPITHGDIQRILAGKEPRDPRKRNALNLSALVPAPACPKCGKVHVTKRCVEHLKNRKTFINWRYLFGMSVEELEWRLQ